MEHFILEYGLFVIFFCAVLENDVTFFLTGVAIHLGLVHPELALIYCVAGALTHDGFWFWLGHQRSDSIRSSGIYRRIGPVVERLAERFGPSELFFCRFIYGTRKTSLVFWGVQRLPLSRFLGIEVLALTIWGCLLAALGFGLSNVTAMVVGQIRSMESWMLGALIIVALALVAARLFTRHQLRKRLAQPHGPI
ncbi:MAG TPA: hypothetical protein VF593_10205 [Chthoniobacteraceae bacterium]|jgi:membrane protein DedA with SNARE-associated domain